MLGCGVGSLASTINPFATGIASGFAGTTISEGIAGRLVLLVVGTALGIVFVMRYARRIKADPAKSLVYADEADNEARCPMPRGLDATRPLTGSQKVVLALFFLAFAMMIYGVIPWEDLGIAHPDAVVVVPRDDRLVPPLHRSWSASSGGWARAVSRDTFVDGARDLLGVALIIGIARGITVIMNNGLITDTVLNGRRQAVERPRRGGVRQPHVLPVPAAVVPHPVVLGPGDGRHADHGAARELRERPGRARRDRLPDRPTGS